MSSDTMLEEAETLDRPNHAPDDGGSDPIAGELGEGYGTEGSGGDPETPTRPRAPKRRPRKVRSLTLDDWLSLGGSALASFALMYVGYLHVVDFSGTVGFAVCWYVVFLLVYGTVVAIANPRHIVTERLVAATLYLIAALVVFALASTVIYTFAEGWRAFVHVNFFTHDMAGVASDAPLNQGGIFHAIVGTVIMVGMAVVVAVPLGIGTAVYMTEVKGPGSHLIRTVVEAMTALSDILAGLFVYATLVVGFGLGKTGLAAAIAIAVTMLPLVARASEVALRVVPGGLREASEALGATHWKTTWKVVLPSARAGLVTAAILAIARGIGETAVVLVTTGASSFLNFNPVSEPMNSLPLYIYTAYETHEPLALTRAFGAASVLLAMVLLLFVVARWIVRDKSGRDGSRFLARAQSVRRADSVPSRRLGRGGGAVRRFVTRAAAVVVAALVLSSLVGAALPAGAATPQQINGSGSSWAANAINQWVHDVYSDGVDVTFNPDGDAQGRQDFANKVSDFSVTADGYQGFDSTTGRLRYLRRPCVRLFAGGLRWHLVSLSDQISTAPRSRTSGFRERPWPRSSPTRSPTGTTPKSPRTTTGSSCRPSRSSRWSSPRAPVPPSN